jgi:Fur family transcriptional regulator, iron response regulator
MSIVPSLALARRSGSRGGGSQGFDWAFQGGNSLSMLELNNQTDIRLRKAGLRPTRQRRDLAQLLFSQCQDAVTAEGLHAFALRSGIKVSLATVYGTLHSFCTVGLVRDVSIDTRRYFDINPENHQYFYYEDDKRLVGVTEAETGVKDVPSPPRGQHVSRIDVVVRLKRDRAA